jgi:hypothetical protein
MTGMTGTKLMRLVSVRLGNKIFAELVDFTQERLLVKDDKEKLSKFYEYIRPLTVLGGDLYLTDKMSRCYLAEWAAKNTVVLSALELENNFEGDFLYSIEAY